MTARHSPTPELRAVVERACAAGFTQPEIGKILGLSDRSLRKHYRHELDNGAVKANAAVAGRLYQIAMGDDKRTALGAAIFICKTRLGWREQGEVNVTVGSAAPVLVSPGLCDPQRWNEMAREYTKHLAETVGSDVRQGRPDLLTINSTAQPLDGPRTDEPVLATMSSCNSNRSPISRS